MDDTSENPGCVTPKRIFGALALWAFVLFLGLAGAGYWWASQTGRLGSGESAPDAEASEIAPGDADSARTTEVEAAEDAATELDAELPGEAAEIDLSATADLSLEEDGASPDGEPEPEEEPEESRLLADEEVLAEIEAISDPTPAPTREAPSARADAGRSQADRDAERAAEREQRDARRAAEAEERRRADEIEAERAAEREARTERARETERVPEPEPEPRDEPAFSPLKISSRLVDGPPRIKALVEGDVACDYELRIEVIRVNAAGAVVGEPKRQACAITPSSSPACELKVQTGWMAGGSKISVSTWAAKHKSCPSGAPTPSKKKREYGG